LVLLKNIKLVYGDLMLVIRVKCPRCGYEFTTRTLKVVKCPNCSYHFKVYYRVKEGRKWYWRSRVVKIEKGTLSDLMKKFEKLKREKYEK